MHLLSQAGIGAKATHRSLSTRMEREPPPARMLASRIMLPLKPNLGIGIALMDVVVVVVMLAVAVVAVTVAEAVVAVAVVVVLDGVVVSVVVDVDVSVQVEEMAVLVVGALVEVFVVVAVVVVGGATDVVVVDELWAAIAPTAARAADSKLVTMATAVVVGGKKAVLGSRHCAAPRAACGGGAALVVAGSPGRLHMPVPAPPATRVGLAGCRCSGLAASPWPASSLGPRRPSLSLSRRWNEWRTSALLRGGWKERAAAANSLASMAPSWSTSTAEKASGRC
mmetsp:Transcript_27794/g.58797  ORF Transcript_27794/g.58797 Transcript_27794/m.58797 type:complete len:281 (+) Transcript_27794:239-1081(+)